MDVESTSKFQLGINLLDQSAVVQVMRGNNYPRAIIIPLSPIHSYTPLHETDDFLVC